MIALTYPKSSARFPFPTLRAQRPNAGRIGELFQRLASAELAATSDATYAICADGRLVSVARTYPTPVPDSLF